MAWLAREQSGCAGRDNGYGGCPRETGTEYSNARAALNRRVQLSACRFPSAIYDHCVNLLLVKPHKKWQYSLYNKCIWPCKGKSYRFVVVGRTVQLWLKQFLSTTVDVSSARRIPFGLRNAMVYICRSQGSGVAPFFDGKWRREHNVVQRLGPTNDEIFIKMCWNMEGNFSVSLSMPGDLFVFKILARKKVNLGRCWLLSLYKISKPHRMLCISAFIRSAGKSFKYKMFMGRSVHKWKHECYLSSLTVIPLGCISRARPGGMEVTLVGQREESTDQTADSSSREHHCPTSSPSILSSACWI